VNDAVEKEVLLEDMVSIYADNVLEKKLKKWGLKNFHRKV